MKRKVILFFILIVLVFFGIYSYIYKSHRIISNEDSLYSVSVNQLMNDYSKDEDKANQKYLDKTITVSGVVTALNNIENSVTVDNKLFGIVNTGFMKLKMNDSLTFKGRFIGYDELLEEVKMDQIIVLE